MHDGQYRTLEDAVRFFVKGGASSGFVGVSENLPRNLSEPEIQQLVAFLRALDGTGPDPALLARPPLP
jgi:cytochrome c peroxidase